MPTPYLKGGKFVKHIACTSPACTSSDAMAVYVQEDGTQDATCFSCGHYDSNPSGASMILDDQSGETRAKVHSVLSVAQISECPTRGIPSREIHLSTSEFYGVRTLLAGYDGKTPVALAFPYYNTHHTIIGYKKRLLSEKIFNVIGTTKDCLLFGAHKFPSGKKLYITEGEVDALSLYQILKDLAGREWRHLDPCVVSIPHGARTAAASLGRNREYLAQFEEVVLVFDQDEAGQAAAASVGQFLDPSKTKIAHFSEKDANDMLMKGKSTELKWAVLSHAQPYQPEGITTSKELLTQALTTPERGLDWPWATMTKLTLGRRPGIHLFGAGVGVGKTELFHELCSHILIKDKRPVGVFLLEEAPSRSLRILGGKQINVPTHRADIARDNRSLEQAIRSFSDPRELLFLFDHKGSRDWDTIYSQAKYLAAVHGVRDIIIDPLTAIIAHEESTDRALHRIMSEMYTLVADPFNCTVYVSSHLNEPPRDKAPHEEGGRVYESQFAGSRAMIRFSDYVWGMERNKQAADVVERNTTTIRNLKDRDHGIATGETFSLFYDQSTGRYLEPNESF